MGHRPRNRPQRADDLRARVAHLIGKKLGQPRPGACKGSRRRGRFRVDGLFEQPDIGEEELRKLREKDVLSELMRELGEAMPAVKVALIDEPAKCG